LILLPGVAFDHKSNRVSPSLGFRNVIADMQLGRGKAYYDNFLHLYTSSRSSPLLGKRFNHGSWDLLMI
jgi:5-formyltetrahydrofolate cyclo-ligase